MDQRQTQIRERAGLEEARINQDFVLFLQKWGTPVLLVLAAISLAYFLWNKQKQRTADRSEQAFAEFNASLAGESPSPEALQQIAEDYRDVPGVSDLAALAAADAHLRMVIAGVKPTATLNPDGTLASPDDALTADERAAHLDRAQGLYARVLDDSKGNPARLLRAVQSLYGLAAVAESRGQNDQAKARYEELAALTESTEFVIHARIARERAAALDQPGKPLLSKKELAWLFPPEPPAAAPAPVSAEPVGPPQPAPTPEAPAQPAPGASEPTPAQPAPTDPAPAQPTPPANPGGR